MLRAQVITFWVDDSGSLSVDLERFLKEKESCMDAVGQPAQNLIPDPNVVVWEVWCSQETLDLIAADPEYGEGAILFSEPMEDVDVVPPSEEILEG